MIGRPHSLLVVALGSYERVFWLLTAALAAGTEVSRESTPPAGATDRSAA